MNSYLFSIKEVAAILNVPPYRITYLLNIGKVAEPKMRLGNRRAFTVEDIDRLSKELCVALPDNFNQEDQDE
jgi:DNA-binding transcriptional MerR regulator